MNLKLNMGTSGFSLIEVLVALLLLCLTALGGSAIGVQAVKSTNKSKVSMLAMQIEAEVLDLSSNKSYGWGPYAVQLRNGQAPPRLILNKNDFSYVIPLGESGFIYFDSLGNRVNSNEPWVLSLELSYKMIRPVSGTFLAEYGLAYHITYSSQVRDFIGSAIRDRGKKTGDQFQGSDYTLPLATSIYSGSAIDYVNGDGSAADPGRCRTGELPAAEKSIIGIKEINLLTGQAKCALTPERASCSDSQISNAVSVTEDEFGNSYYDMNCVNRRRCGCSHIDAKNWVITDYVPAAMFYEVPVCGTCEFAFLEKVNARMSRLSDPEKGHRYSVCPSMKYKAVGVSCSVSFKFIAPTDAEQAAAGIDPAFFCADEVLPARSGDVVADSNGGITCLANDPQAKSCGGNWVSKVSFSVPENACVLQEQPRPAIQTGS